MAERKANLICDPTGDAHKGMKVLSGDTVLAGGTKAIATGMTVASVVATSKTANAVSVVFAGGTATFTGTGTDGFYYLIIGQ